MIALIVINFRKSDLTIELCSSLVEVENRELIKLFLVDNASTPESQSALRQIAEMPLNVEFIFEKENWGYFGGARRAIQSMERDGFEPAWVIISNSDIVFTDRKFFSRLVRYSRENVGVLAPKVLSELSDTSQNPYLLARPGSLRMHFYKWVFRFRATCYIYQMAGLIKSLVKKTFALNTGSLDRTKKMDIYAAHGSFLVFTDRYFEAGGNFAHVPFLFGEEITVAENCRRLGLKISYEPEFSVTHKEHASMGVFPSKKMLEWQKEASAFCADTYFKLD